MRENKLIILVAESNAGKDTTLNAFVDMYDVKKVVSHTSRPMRSYEKEGVDYHFISREQFIQMEKDGLFIESRHYNTIQDGQDTVWYYGVAKSEINLEEASSIIIVDLHGLGELEDYFGKESIISFYLDVDEGVRMNRALNRGDNKEEVIRRFEDDRIKFELAREKTDHTIYNDGSLTPNDIACLMYEKIV